MYYLYWEKLHCGGSYIFLFTKPRCHNFMLECLQVAKGIMPFWVYSWNQFVLEKGLPKIKECGVDTARRRPLTIWEGVQIKKKWPTLNNYWTVTRLLRQCACCYMNGEAANQSSLINSMDKSAIYRNFGKMWCVILEWYQMRPPDPFFDPLLCKNRFKITCPSFFCYDNDKDLKVCFLMTCVICHVC